MGLVHWIATPSLRRAAYMGKELEPPRKPFAAILEWSAKDTILWTDEVHPLMGVIRAWIDLYGRPDTIIGCDSADGEDLFLTSLKEPPHDRSTRPGWVVESLYTDELGRPWSPDRLAVQDAGKLQQALRRTYGEHHLIIGRCSIANTRYRSYVELADQLWRDAFALAVALGSANGTIDDLEQKILAMERAQDEEKP